MIIKVEIALIYTRRFQIERQGLALQFGRLLLTSLTALVQTGIAGRERQNGAFTRGRAKDCEARTSGPSDA